MDLAAGHGHVEAVDRGQSAELNREAFGHEQGLAFSGFIAGPQMHGGDFAQFDAGDDVRRHTEPRRGVKEPKLLQDLAEQAHDATGHEIEREEQQAAEDHQAVVVQVVEQIRQNHHDQRAEAIADDRSGAAENQHDEEQHGQLEGERGGADVFVDVAEERTRETREGGAQDERRELGPVPAHAGAVRRDRAFLECFERASPIAAHDMVHHDEAEDHDRIDEVEEVVPLEIDGPVDEPGNLLDARGTLGQPHRLIDDRLDDEPEGNRGDGQVRAAQTQRGDPEDDAEDRRERRAGHHANRERQMQFPHQDRGGVRAHREQARVARRDIAGISHHEVEACHDDDVDAHLAQDRVHDVLVADEVRNEHQRDRDKVRGVAFYVFHARGKGKLEGRSSKLEESGIKAEAGS